MSKKRLILVTILSVVGVVLVALGTSYALFTRNITKNSNFKTKVGSLELAISDTNTEDRIVINNLVPVKDATALTEDGYTFTVTNSGSIDAYYTVYLEDIVPAGETKNRIPDNLMHINLSESTSVKEYNTRLVSELNNGVITAGILSSGDSITYTLRLWLDYNADNSAQGKYYASRIRIDSTQEKSIIYDSTTKVLAQFKPSELDKAVMCDNYSGVYTNCSVYSSINEAINSRNNGLLVLTDNITTGTITIPENKNIILDLNGKTLEYDYSELGNGSFATFDDIPVLSMISNRGKLTINGDGDGKIISSFNVNDIQVDSYNSGDNDTEIRAIKKISMISNENELTITGGSYISGYSVFYNDSSATLNINQADNYMYINGTVGFLLNVGNTSINGSQANECTLNPDDTITGLCIYSGGSSVENFGTMTLNGGTYVNPLFNIGEMVINDGFFYSESVDDESLISSNGIGLCSSSYVNCDNYGLTINDGVFNNHISVMYDTAHTSFINGGTFNGSLFAINNTILNIRNIRGEIVAASDDAVVNICDSTIKQLGGSGVVNYNNVTFPNGTTTPDSGMIIGNAVESATCPITNE